MNDTITIDRHLFERIVRYFATMPNVMIDGSTSMQQALDGAEKAAAEGTDALAAEVMRLSDEQRTDPKLDSGNKGLWTATLDVPQVPDVNLGDFPTLHDALCACRDELRRRAEE